MRRVLVVGFAGLVLAAGLGLVTHLIVRDTVGLPATSLQTVAPLAPPEARPAAAPRERQPAPARTTTAGTTTGPAAPATAPATTAAPPATTETGDDDSGRGRGRNRGRGGSSGSGGGRDD